MSINKGADDAIILLCQFLALILGLFIESEFVLKAEMLFAFNVWYLTFLVQFDYGLLVFSSPQQQKKWSEKSYLILIQGENRTLERKS